MQSLVVLINENNVNRLAIALIVIAVMCLHSMGNKNKKMTYIM